METNEQYGSIESSINDSRAESEDLIQQVAEWKDLAMRRLAEVENIRRRTNIEKQELLIHAAQHTILNMLPILDDLHAATDASRSTVDVKALQDGIIMIYNKAVRIFEEAGVKVIEANPGDHFDVEKHESLMHQPSDHPEGSIVQYIQRGYQLHEKVLRHAKVITSAGLPEEMGA